MKKSNVRRLFTFLGALALVLGITVFKDQETTRYICLGVGILLYISGFIISYQQQKNAGKDNDRR